MAIRHKIATTGWVAKNKRVIGWMLESGVVSHVSGGRLRVLYRGGGGALPCAAANHKRGL